MRIAIQGCGHGNLDSIYASLAKLERIKGLADLLIVCGDFQAIRDKVDLQAMACPVKYRHMGDFYNYYTGAKQAPVLTLFIGGNHEASNHLSELYHGGWVAPNIYFMGYAGVFSFGGIRIASVSGLYEPRDYQTGYYERPPYTPSTIRSVYHTREFDIKRLLMLNESKIDIFISHEWPHRVYNFGNVKDLLRKKPYFQSDIEGKGIGAPPLCTLLDKLGPKKWFAAHMHVEFEASIPHPDNTVTEFLALDKCLPRGGHMRMIELEEKTITNTNNGKFEFSYDREWLAIVKAMNPFMSFTRSPSKIPTTSMNDLINAKEFINTLDEESLKIPKKYMRPSNICGKRTTLLQTAEFCKLLCIKDHWNEPSLSNPTNIINNPDEIDIK